MAKSIQLIYISAATRQFDSIDLTALLSKARQKNERLKITGMLVYHGNSFLQVLEGPETAVDELYRQITQDSRHTNCTVLLRSYIDRRNFGDWTMGFVNTKLFGPKSLAGYNDFFGKKFSNVEFAQDPSLAHRLLLAFREGQWRQSVEIESPENATVA